MFWATVVVPKLILASDSFTMPCSSNDTWGWDGCQRSPKILWNLWEMVVKVVVHRRANALKVHPGTVVHSLGTPELNYWSINLYCEPGEQLGGCLWLEGGRQRFHPFCYSLSAPLFFSTGHTFWFFGRPAGVKQVGQDGFLLSGEGAIPYNLKENL